jgi:hypothetical protein
VPAALSLEVHIDTAWRFSLGTAPLAELLAGNVRGWQRGPAESADLASEALADGRRAFTTHGWEYSEEKANTAVEFTSRLDP